MHPTVTGVIAGDGNRLFLRSASQRQGLSRFLLNALQVRRDPVSIGPENALVKTDRLPQQTKGSSPGMNSIKNDLMDGRHSGRGWRNLRIGHRGIKCTLQLDQRLGLIGGKVLDLGA